MNNTTFFGFQVSENSFDYLNEDREEDEPQITPENIQAGLTKAQASFDDVDSRLKNDLFEYVIDLCDGFILDEASKQS